MCQTNVIDHKWCGSSEERVRVAGYIIWGELIKELVSIDR